MLMVGADCRVSTVPLSFGAEEVYKQTTDKSAGGRYYPQEHTVQRVICMTEHGEVADRVTGTVACKVIKKEEVPEITEEMKYYCSGACHQADYNAVKQPLAGSLSGFSYCQVVQHGGKSPFEVLLRLIELLKP